MRETDVISVFSKGWKCDESGGAGYLRSFYIHAQAEDMRKKTDLSLSSVLYFE